MGHLRAVVVLVAVLGVLGGVAYLAGVLPGGTTEVASDEATETVEPVAPPAARAPAAPHSPPVPPIAPSSRGPQVYRACAAPDRAVVAVAQVVGDPRPDVILGCGASFDVLALRPGAFALDRVAHIEARTDEPTARALASKALIDDITADGLPDLLLPFYHRAETGEILGGQLFLVPRLESGAFAPALRLGNVSVAGLATGRLDRTPGPDVVLIHAPPGKTPELWIVSGGTAPGRVALAPLADDTSVVVTGDFNSDGETDVASLVDAGPSAQAELRFGDGAAGFIRKVTVRAPGARSLIGADLDGDSDLELVTTGEALASISIAPGSATPVSTSIDATALEEVELADMDGDGRLDVLGLKEGKAVWLRQTAPRRFERQPFFEVESGAILRWAVGDLDGDQSADIVAVLQASPGQELLLAAPSPRAGVAIRTPATPQPIVDAPLKVDLTTY